MLNFLATRFLALTQPEPQSFTGLFAMLKADLPFNQAPSLHVSFAIVLWYSMQERLKSLWQKVILALWFGVIAFSTLFVYQHHFIDLPTGALVGFLAVYLISKKRENKILKAFMTPRSLKMALYYLVASALFMVLAFKVSVLFLYIFISLFLVSVVYAFGIHEMISRYWFFHILLLPYYWGNYLSYRYYKPKLSLLAEVKEDVYFGRFPTFEEYGKLKEEGINSVLNLAWEQPRIDTINLYRKRLPLLDQTIPNPKLLHEAVLFIEEHQKEGVFVHCALGLSRSVLVISAWLLYTGHSRDEVEKIMKEVRPNYVKSAYMGIALDIYGEEYVQ